MQTVTGNGYISTTYMPWKYGCRVTKRIYIGPNITTHRMGEEHYREHLTNLVPALPPRRSLRILMRFAAAA